MPKRDLHQEITDRIIGLIEKGAADPSGWRAPWSLATGAGLPHNAIAKRAYSGINVLLLWATAMDREYPTHEWATYKQWSGADCQVRGGEKSTLVVFYKMLRVKPREGEQPDGKEDDGKRGIRIMRSFLVFNAAQVDGWEPPEPPEPIPGHERDDEIEAFVEATGADIRYDSAGVEAAFYPGRDRIVLPDRDLFKSIESFHSTRFHELTHWTGHEDRLARKLSFGRDADYATEELVAELGAAFLCAGWGLEHDYPKSADYVANWLTLLKEHKQAVMQAASAANRSVAFLHELAEVEAVTA